MDSDIRDKVVETHTMMKGVNKRLEKIDTMFDDHEKRIRAGEKFRSWFIGLFTTSAAGGGAFASFKHFIDGGGPGG